MRTRLVKRWLRRNSNRIAKEKVFYGKHSKQTKKMLKMIRVACAYGVTTKGLPPVVKKEILIMGK